MEHGISIKNNNGIVKKLLLMNVNVSIDWTDKIKLALQTNPQLLSFVQQLKDYCKITEYHITSARAQLLLSQSIVIKIIINTQYDTI